MCSLFFWGGARGGLLFLVTLGYLAEVLLHHGDELIDIVELALPEVAAIGSELLYLGKIGAGGGELVLKLLLLCLILPVLRIPLCIL